MEIKSLLAWPENLESLPPETRILYAALTDIEEQGLANVTVRGIAAKAGMNLAAINYYYRSKDKLIEAALRSAWGHARSDIMAIVDRRPPSPRELARDLLAYLVEGVGRNPRVLAAILIEHPKLRAEAAESFRLLIADAFRGTEAQIEGPRPPKRAPGAGDLGFTLLLFVSLAVVCSLAPEFPKALAGVQIQTQAGRAKFVEEVVKMVG